MLTSFGTNIGIARIKRVYYTESSTIYEGMPVCYEFDATINVLGYDKGAGGRVDCQSSPTTTAEGNQNEGKYLRVEDVDDDNVCAFAGVVAGTSDAGKIGPRWLDVYIPNGAVVPVRTNQNCTVGKTILAIHTAEQALTAPFEAAGRAVAVAWETVDRSGGTSDGICLAKLSDTMFIYQKGDGVRLEVDDEDTGNMMVNQIIVGTSQASGLFSALQIKAYQTAGNAESWDYGLALNVSGDFAAGTINNNANVSGHWLNLGAVTITGGSRVSALRAGIYEGGNCVFTNCGVLSPLSLAVQVATDPGTGFCQIYCRNDGAQAIDAFIIAESAAAVLFVADTTGTNQSGYFPIIIGGTTHYFHLFDGAQGAT